VTYHDQETNVGLHHENVFKSGGGGGKGKRSATSFLIHKKSHEREDDTHSFVYTLHAQASLHFPAKNLTFKHVLQTKDEDTLFVTSIWPSHLNTAPSAADSSSRMLQDKRTQRPITCLLLLTQSDSRFGHPTHSHGCIYTPALYFTLSVSMRA
jgi:hypothetical protein